MDGKYHSNLTRMFAHLEHLYKHLRGLELLYLRGFPCGTFGCSEMIPPGVIQHYMKWIPLDEFRNMFNYGSEMCCDRCTEKNFRFCKHNGPRLCARFRVGPMFSDCDGTVYTEHCRCGEAYECEAYEWTSCDHIACSQCEGKSCDVKPLPDPRFR